MVSDRLFDRACNDLQAQTKKVFELAQTHNALRARVARLENGLKSILAVRKTAQAMEMPETWSIASTQMESIARNALEEK